MEFLDRAAIWRKDEAHPEGEQADYDEALEHGILPYILVPDAEEHYRNAIRMGCRMFTSDNPAEAVKIL